MFRASHDEVQELLAWLIEQGHITQEDVQGAIACRLAKEAGDE